MNRDHDTFRVVKQASRAKHTVAETATLVGDTTDLLAFCLTADHGSLTRAARELSESKATVSRRIARLEGALGIALLERTPRAVRLTDDGAWYKARVTEVLELLAQANDGARGAQAIPEGRLRVTWGPEFSAMLAPLIVEFSRLYPRVSLELVVTQALLDLERERVDVALRVASQLADSALVAQKVIDLSLAFVASPTYLAARGRPKSPEQLAQHSLVALRHMRDTRVVFRHRSSGRRADLEITPTTVATDMNCVVDLTRAGAGIGLVPRCTILRDLAEGTLVEVLQTLDVAGASIFLVHRGGRFLAPKVRVFRDFMLKHVPRVALA